MEWVSPSHRRQSIHIRSVVELGQLADFIEATEPFECFEGAVVVLGEVAAVELLESLLARPEAGVGVEEGVESFSVGDGDGVASAQQGEAGPNTSGSNAGLTPSGWRRWTSGRTCVSPAVNHLMWKRSSTWRACPRWVSMVQR